MFGSIERLVGLLKQLVSLFHRDRGSCVDPNAQGYGNLVFSCDDRILSHAQPDSIGNVAYRMGIASGDEDQELFSAIPSHEVVGAQRGLHSPRNLAQRNVAADMAELIVDDLEVIDIGNEYADHRSLARRLGTLAREEIQDRGTGEAFVRSGMPKSTPDLSAENFAQTSMSETSALQNVASKEPQETAKAGWETRKSRQDRPANPLSMEPALKVADYEKVVAASAKARLAQQQQPSPRLAAQKGQDESPSGGRAKATEHDNPPLDRHQLEPDNPGKKSAYRVQEGDTLYSIARKHDMDVDELKKMNHLTQTGDINYGQTLMVPSKEPGKKSPAKAGAAIKPSQSAKYTAHEGETLFSISRRFNVTVADLRKWNGIKEDKQFRSGMNITVSGEKD